MVSKYVISQIRSDFPMLKQKMNGHPLIYLDNAASAQKPKDVIDCENNYYSYEYASVHRSIYSLSNKVTIRIENIRDQIAKFINAYSSEEIIFVKGATEGINLVANSWGRSNLSPGDNILITEMEHHSNIVPWQILANERQLILRYIPLLPDGTLDVDKLSVLVDQRTRLFAVTQLSNVLGTLNPIFELISQIRKLSNAVVLVDGSQGIIHQKVDVQKLDCDFYVFSGHKLYGPTGIGILYAKKILLNNMPPWEGGGSMIKTVSLTKGTTINDVPWRFEAGSPNTSGIIGLGAAITYIKKIGVNKIYEHEAKIMEYTKISLKKIPDLITYGPCDAIGVISFNLGKHHAYDVASFLNQYGIAIRTGHHCAMPLMLYFKVTSMCRVSFAMYTNFNDIDCLISGLLRIRYLLNR